MSTVLTSERVKAVFETCVIRDHASWTNSVPAQGIKHRMKFDPDRLEEYRQEIHDMLAELPDKFKTSGSGGANLLLMSVDKHGNAWADRFEVLDCLLKLGDAIGEIEFREPQDVVSAARLPFFTIKQ